ncbi:MAG TPA: sigma factor, partial [Polyangia bacterium]
MAKTATKRAAKTAKPKKPQDPARGEATPADSLQRAHGNDDDANDQTSGNLDQDAADRDEGESDEAALAPLITEAEILPARRPRPRGHDNKSADDADEVDDALDDLEPPAATPSGKHLAPLRNPVQRFLAEARMYPRLSEEEERQLIENVRERGDKDAARRLVVHNLRLVISIAYQYRQAWTNVLDLFQEGSVGVLEAVKH